MPRHSDGETLARLTNEVWVFAAATSFLSDAARLGEAEARASDPGRGELLRRASLFDPGPVADELRDPSRAAALLSVIRQAAAAASGDASSEGWRSVPDSALIAQGRASGGLGRFIAERIVPELAGLEGRLANGGSILDVGSGVGELSFALAQGLGGAHVTGIDIYDRAIGLALERRHGLAADIRDRVEFLRQDVTTLDGSKRFDLVWLPAPFISDDALDVALDACFGATAEEGWILVGTSATPADELGEAVARWSSALMGGSSADPTRAAELLAAHGYVDVRVRPTVPGAPTLVAGRRGAQASVAPPSTEATSPVT